MTEDEVKAEWSLITATVESCPATAIIETWQQQRRDYRSKGSGDTEYTSRCAESVEEIVEWVVGAKPVPPVLAIAVDQLRRLRTLRNRFVVEPTKDLAALHIRWGFDIFNIPQR